MYDKKFYNHQDKLYLILQEVPEVKVNDKKGKPNLDLLKAWRDWVGANHVLRVSHSYLLCETVQELEFEEILEEYYQNRKKQQLCK